jgi:ATP-dependent RNA helicase DDX23/PRP28
LKAQRQELALKRRQEESVEQLKRNKEQRKLLMGIESKGKQQEDKDRQREKERDRDCDYGHEAHEARERERDRERRERDQEREEAKNRERKRLEKQMMREHEKELEAIKEQYLGAKKLKKRVVKPSEKFRFSFDWENTEDTSGDMNPM